MNISQENITIIAILFSLIFVAMGFWTANWANAFFVIGEFSSVISLEILTTVLFGVAATIILQRANLFLAVRHEV